MKKLILAVVGLAALSVGIIGVGGPSTPVQAADPIPTPTPNPPPPPADFRVEVACSPLTSSQSADPGDPQTCRIRLRNNSDSLITGITYVRPTPNTITARYPLKTSYGITCDLSGCAPFSLAPGASVIIIEKSTFNATQDGRGKTTATAFGILDGESISASGTEQHTLP